MHPVKRTLTNEEIAKLKLEDNLSLSKISNMTGITRQRVSQIVHQHLNSRDRSIVSKKDKPKRNVICPYTKKRCYIKWHNKQMSLNCHICDIYQSKKRIGVSNDKETNQRTNS